MLFKLARERAKKKYYNYEKGQTVPRGFVVGRTEKNKFVCVPSSTDFHFLIWGGTGSGKTSAVIIPTLQSWGARFFAIDISGDILKHTHTSRSVFFAPFNKGGQPYDIFFIMNECKFYNSKMFEAAELIAHSLVPMPTNLGDTEKYYRARARNILEASLIHYHRLGFVDFGAVAEKIITTNINDLLSAIYDDNIPYTRGKINQFNGMKTETLAGCFDSLIEFVSPFSSERMKKHLKKGGINPRMLAHKDIYIVIPERELERCQSLLTLICAQTLAYINERKIDGSEIPLLICLDELGALGAIDGLDNALATARKRNVHIVGACQTLSQLRVNYGKDKADTLCGNFTHKICLGLNDTDSQEYFAKLVGRETKAKSGYSHSSYGESFADQEREDYILEPASLAYIKNKNELIYLCDKGYCILNRNPYFDDVWKKRRKK